MNKKIIAITIFICLQWNAKAQSTKQIPLQLHTEALGSIVYPGLKIGIEIPKKIFIKEKQNDRKIEKQRLWDIALGFYHHTGFHTNIFIQSERIWRRVRPSGFFTQGTVGIGISRTFLGGATYQLNADGNSVTKQNLAGSFYAMPTFGFGFGKMKQNKNLGWKVKTSLAILGPMGGYAMPLPIIEAGIIYKLQNSKTTTVKIIK